MLWEESIIEPKEDKAKELFDDDDDSNNNNNDNNENNNNNDDKVDIENGQAL